MFKCACVYMPVMTSLARLSRCEKGYQALSCLTFPKGREERQRKEQKRRNHKLKEYIYVKESIRKCKQMIQNKSKNANTKYITSLI